MDLIPKECKQARAMSMGGWLEKVEIKPSQPSWRGAELGNIWPQTVKKTLFELLPQTSSEPFIM